MIRRFHNLCPEASGAAHRCICSNELEEGVGHAQVPDYRTVDEDLAGGTPEIFNTDQGVQYTAHAFTDRLELAGVAISMDGRGRWMDNVFVERLWRTAKYECIYLHDYATPRALEAGLTDFFRFYNDERLHAALDYLTPAAVYAEA